MTSYRTHTCGALRRDHVGRTVLLQGWVHRVRDLGGVTFFDLRDRHGLTRVVAREGSALAQAARLRPEYVVAVSGVVEARDAGVVNTKLATGEIEVVATHIELLNEAKTPPFMIEDDTEVAENLRLKYRYLDLRRPSIQKVLITRHKITRTVRSFLDSHAFVDVETPFLTKSTPEGARDYLVPSRVNPGAFFGEYSTGG